MKKPMHDRIYLLPEDGVWCWADRPAPGIGQSNDDDAVEYVRADLFDQVVAQRDSAKSQLETLKTALDKDFYQLREHSDRLHVENCDIKRVNAELAAQVEVLRSVLVCFHPDCFEYQPNGFDLGDEVSETLSATPESCLAQVKAEAVNAAFRPLKGELEMIDANEVITKEKLERLISLIYKTTKSED